jgi:hypothetical protein
MGMMTVEEAQEIAEVKRVQAKTRVIVQNEREREKTKRRQRVRNKMRRKTRQSMMRH